MKIIGKPDVSLADGLGRAAATGAVMGTVAGIGQAAVEFFYIRVTRGSVGDHTLDSDPMPDTVAEAVETTRLVARANLQVADTKFSRAMLFTVSTSSLAVDAGLEMGGY
jgi:hypothetical protein